MWHRLKSITRSLIVLEYQFLFLIACSLQFTHLPDKKLTQSSREEFCQTQEEIKNP